MSQIETINKELNIELAKESVQKALLATTFKGLTAPVMKQALMEGMMRGFTFKDFLEKNVYAIPFKDKKTGAVGYSLITSIDFARKLGMKNGVVGVSAPVYTEKEGKIETCTVTVKRKVQEYVGEYSATVYFNEYNTGYQQWTSKPRTMIAKVAEMHALRKACPEELSQSYSEEEMEKEIIEIPSVDISVFEARLRAVTSIDELKQAWSSLPVEAKESLKHLKEELKTTYENA